VDVFEQLDVVSIVDIDCDEHRAGRIEGFVQGWCNFVGLLNSQARGAESPGVLMDDGIVTARFAIFFLCPFARVASYGVYQPRSVLYSAPQIRYRFESRLA
jgi:hypothetical protein